MHINQVMIAADYRMVEGRDWIWDFLGKDCREILFESWGLHEQDEHYPVDAVFHCATGDVRQITVQMPNLTVYRWMAADAHAGYVLACRDLGETPYREAGLIWIDDAAVIIKMIEAALHPERRPDDADESYRWEGNQLEMDVVHDNMGNVNVNP
jgi:hypothetical protein